METFKLEIDDTTFNCSVAKTDAERKLGYSGDQAGPKKNECMLFVFPSEGKHQMWMKDTSAALDIVFLDKNLEILEIIKGEPDSDELIGTSGDVAYVIEFLSGACEKMDIVAGDSLEDIPEEYLEPAEDPYSVFILDEDGNVQMSIRGGERIFSRKSTKKLVNMALNAKGDKDFKKLGTVILKEILAQDGRGPDYVKGKTKESYDLDNND